MTTKQRAVQLALGILLDPQSHRDFRLYEQALLKVASNEEDETCSPQEAAIRILTDAICQSGRFSSERADFADL